MSGDDYGRCLNCEAPIPTPESARQHQSETMAPTGESGTTARSHSIRVVNPTPEQKRIGRIRSTVWSAVDDAIMECLDDLDRDVDRGTITRDEVTEGLRDFPDFAGAWDERCDEADE